VKPVLFYLQVVGPVENKELGEKVCQIEMGVSVKDSEKPDVVRLAVPKTNVCEAIDEIMPSVKAFIEKFYPQPKTKV